MDEGMPTNVQGVYFVPGKGGNSRSLFVLCGQWNVENTLKSVVYLYPLSLVAEGRGGGRGNLCLYTQLVLQCVVTMNMTRLQGEGSFHCDSLFGYKLRTCYR